MPDTIAAVATGGVKAAIGVIRLSGDNAIEIAAKVFRPLNGRDFRLSPSRKLVLGSLLSDTGEILDNCLATLSRAPKSYTGEDTVEFHTHGSPVVLSAALKALFSLGARQAEAGEFTKRAFLNGRLDLTQAEAVVDLIDAETEEAAKNAAAQLGGAVSRKTDAVYNELANVSAHFHAVVDYPDEELEPFELDEILKAVEFSEKTLKFLLDGYRRGMVMKEGIRCAIIGKPNAGKSSLLNALLGYDRAIVTPKAGTTRDTIEEKLVFGGALLRLTDTAGLRESSDEAEALGIARARAAADEAELVFAVFDGSKPLEDEARAVIEMSAKAEKSVAVINKCDLNMVLDADELRKYYKDLEFVSALAGTGIVELEQRVKAILSDLYNAPGSSPSSGGYDALITNARQYDAVSRAYSAVLRAKSALYSGFTPDAVLTDTEEAMAAIGELSGRTVREDIVQTIFSRFCVGK
jgi:tRNA modification GTPase